MPSLPHVPPALHPGRRFRSAPPGVRPPAVAGLGAFRDPALCARRTWRAAGVRCGPERPVPAAPRGHVSLVRRGTRSCRFLRGWGLWRALGPTLGRRRRARACPGSPVRVRRSVVPSVQAWESPATGPGDACVAVSLAGDATRSASVAAHSARGLPWRRGRGRGAERPAQGRRGRTRLPEIATRAERGSRPAPAPPPRGRSCLAELQSLSIPGTYQEKITHLGTSLVNLTGLKSLDLSRNSLGVQYLTALESLNLYYNSISSLAEVLRLHSLPELADVDFRLNPVVKNEADYRLFVVHMLPKLRQLDDRPVRESERKASRLHFASEESLSSKQSFPAGFRVGGPCHSRALCADPSAKKCLVMDADDEAVLNLIAECEWDLSNPPGSTSSSQREREADLRSSQESRHLLSPLSAQPQCGDSIRAGHEKRKGSSRGCGPEKRLQDQCWGEPPPQCGQHVHFTPHPVSADMEDSTLSQKSSLSAQKGLNPLPAPGKCRKRRPPGRRSQAPADQEGLRRLQRPTVSSSPEETLSRQSGSEARSERTLSPSEVSEPEDEEPCGRSSTGEVVPKLSSAVPPGKKAALEVALLEALLDLVDRYWSGCKSLHDNEVFRAQARHILSSVQAFATTQDSSTSVSEEMSFLKLENKSLQKRLAEQQRYRAKMGELVSDLSEARKQMDDLRQRLDKSLEENSSLKALLFSLKKEAKNTDATTTLNVQITGLQTSVKRLSGEIVELKQHLEHYDKVQELTQMLQESHSSLVSTNEHLLQELSRVRAQHEVEVEQLHWSYQELKKTLALFPHGRIGR
ncbi:centrosomal protein of 72 kDa isoform X2 [Mustela putorius furo]|uniref:Centrosomal protein of 72 kDa n=1 Tax=Mustela putorius furo TaxID=9669 RepID=A0A8U0V9Y3_MUSPF|nr:centrosomal protein of 72 kDa isoform X2 [Mustela putorius furo]